MSLLFTSALGGRYQYPCFVGIRLVFQNPQELGRSPTACKQQSPPTLLLASQGGLSPQSHGHPGFLKGVPIQLGAQDPSIAETGRQVSRLLLVLIP